MQEENLEPMLMNYWARLIRANGKGTVNSVVGLNNLAILAQQAPLVGRESELRLLEERLDEAFAGKGDVVLLSGEAGIGKSSLADEFGSRGLGEIWMRKRGVLGRGWPMFDDLWDEWG